MPVKVAEDGAVVFTKVDEGGRQRSGRVLEDGAQVGPAAGAGEPLLAAECALLAAFIQLRDPPDIGVFRGEIGLKGAVFPLAGAARAEAALVGTSELNAPPPSGRLVRNVRGRPVTWETP